MAITTHLGMIKDSNMSRLIETVAEEYGNWTWFNTWMKKHYNAREITDMWTMCTYGLNRVYEFDDEDKFVEFCLTWLG